MKELILVAILLTSILPQKAVLETIIYESASEPLEGQIEVSKVIRNRARLRRKTFTEIVFQKKQFSCNNHLKNRREYSILEWNTAYKAWLLSIVSKSKATMYHTVDSKPYWVDSCEYLYTIKNHKFYKEEK